MMGFFRILLDWLGFTGRKCNVIVVGLDNSGKTTAIERLKPKSRQAVEVAPTVGFNVEQFHRGGLEFVVFDMSGAGRYRVLWEQYYSEAEAVIFVVDSADQLRLVVARDELHAMLRNGLLGKRAPFLFLANKRDLPGAMPPADIAAGLELEGIRDRPWQIAPANALTGEGVGDALDWLAERLHQGRGGG